MIKKILRFFDILVGLIFFPAWVVGLIILFFTQFLFKPRQNSSILVFSWHPITMYATLARALNSPERVSQSATKTYFNKIQRKNDWDLLIDNSFNYFPLSVKLMILYILFMKKFDVFILSCDGFLFGLTPIRRIESLLFKLFNKKTIIIPYGGDAYIYKRISSPARVHGLQISYPEASQNQKSIAQRVDYWVQHADLFIPGCMYFEGYGRWDVLIPSTVFIDVDSIIPSERKSLANGKDETVYVTHSPNHRGVKGTNFIIDAIRELKFEGLKVELILTEGMQNSELMKVYQHDSDIHVEQLLLNGGINCIEGMACGLPVISNLGPDDQYQLLRDFSYFDECPVQFGTPSTIKSLLRALITNPPLRLQLAEAGIKYAKQYQSFQSARILFNLCIDYLMNNGEHPSIYNEKITLNDDKTSHALKKNNHLAE